MAQDDPVELDGRAAAHDGAWIVIATIEEVPGAIRVEGSEVEVIAADGARTGVATDERTVIATRELRGPWHEVRQHPAAPAIDLAADRTVTLRGSWVLADEPVAVAGVALDGARVRAIAIAAGPDREARLAEARAQAGPKPLEDHPTAGTWFLDRVIVGPMKWMQRMRQFLRR